MKTLRGLVLTTAIALLLPACVAYPVRGGVAVGVAPAGYYNALPRGYASPYYLHGGRYYYGGRWETGRFRYGGRYYTGRYVHNGRHIYGGHYYGGHAGHAGAHAGHPRHR